MSLWNRFVNGTDTIEKFLIITTLTTYGSAVTEIESIIKEHKENKNEKEFFYIFMLFNGIAETVYGSVVEEEILLLLHLRSFFYYIICSK